VPKNAKKTVARREYTKADVKELRAHSKAKTPVVKIAKLTKRSVGSLRQKALKLGIPLAVAGVHAATDDVATDVAPALKWQIRADLVLGAWTTVRPCGDCAETNRQGQQDYCELGAADPAERARCAGYFWPG
jgi:hypothetical protein